MKTILKTPLGLALIEGDATGITKISITEASSIPSYFTGLQDLSGHSVAPPLNESKCSEPVSEEDLSAFSKGRQELQKAVLQLQEYFAGTRSHFSFKIAPRGTDFQQKVWQALLEIPFGKTLSYLSLAQQLGDPKAIRAVATANGKNPLWIVIPCHRVIGSDGSLTGYAGGLWRKKWLLDHENPPKQTSLF